MSYCPRLFHLRLKFLFERRSLAIDDLFILIDISDVYDEVGYQLFEPTEPGPFDDQLMRLGKALRSLSLLYYGFDNLFGDRVQRSRSGRVASWANLPPGIDSDPLFLEDGLWTVDRTSYERYGRPGLLSAAQNMKRLLEMCRARAIECHIVVYPWPTQILFRDLESVQVEFWQEFATESGVEFIDLFPAFLLAHESPDTVHARYFIPGDVHWNEAGHRLVAARLGPQVRNAIER